MGVIVMDDHMRRLSAQAVEAAQGRLLSPHGSIQARDRCRQDAGLAKAVQLIDEAELVDTECAWIGSRVSRPSNLGRFLEPVTRQRDW